MNNMILGTLLCAASLFAQSVADPRLDEGKLHWIQPGLTTQQVQKLLGPPHISAVFGNEFLSWQYKLGGDPHDPSHMLVFRRGTGRLVSITRIYETDQSVAEFFPPAQSEMFTHEGNPSQPYPVLLRRLPQECFLLAMGATRQRLITSQLILVDREGLSVFHSWLPPLLEKPVRP